MNVFVFKLIFYSFDYERVHVVLGDYVNNTNVRPQRFYISQHYKDPKGELLLMKLNASVDLNEYIRPVCLSQPESNISKPLMEIGWGLENVLRNDEFDLISNSTCERNGTQICASRNVNICDKFFEVRASNLFHQIRELIAQFFSV